MIDFDGLAGRLAGGPLSPWAQSLPRILREAFDPRRHGDMARWLAAYDALPLIDPVDVSLDSSVVRAGRPGDADDDTRARLEAALRAFIPWRKGPFEIAGLPLDTEWRSDLKWDRLCGAIDPLRGRLVLDVGCGSGYHCWRMIGAGARTVIGVDPMLLYVLQFLALRRYLGDRGAFVLPLRLEDLPPGSRAFDTVFSMGVLYHRRSPFDHLAALRGALRPGGQLVLETLVVDGDADTALVPAGRYARMGNVWFIPSVTALAGWLGRMKFDDIDIVDVSRTLPSEQRRTAWMPFESLEASLDPADPERTVEGYPSPRRAVITARAL